MRDTISRSKIKFASLGGHVISSISCNVIFRSALTNGQSRQHVRLLAFQIDEIPWMAEANFTFNVIFDSQRSLNTGKHFIVTPVQLLYYKEYSENPPGHVITKGVPYSTPLETLSIEVEIPGKISSVFIRQTVMKNREHFVDEN